MTEIQRACIAHFHEYTHLLSTRIIHFSEVGCKNGKECYSPYFQQMAEWLCIGKPKLTFVADYLPFISLKRCFLFLADGGGDEGPLY
ncbi:hypothetical protein [Paenibacillus sp. FSL H7-0756]|uniref:hypothetical protein n=1 Tax=Paenibacillus sp. FSL H7-0756 TaxID=2954738 RepID=UPI0030F8DB98